jgi:hypothetical protein
VADKKSAPVRLSAHAEIEEVVGVEATAPMPPAIIAPARNVAANFPDLLIFISFIPTILSLAV